MEVYLVRETQIPVSGTFGCMVLMFTDNEVYFYSHLGCNFLFLFAKRLQRDATRFALCFTGIKESIVEIQIFV